jgi:hypothetical protein
MESMNLLENIKIMEPYLIVDEEGMSYVGFVKRIRQAFLSQRLKIEIIQKIGAEPRSIDVDRIKSINQLHVQGGI